MPCHGASFLIRKVFCVKCIFTNTNSCTLFAARQIYLGHRCPEAPGNTVCWDGGIGTSPLRSRQRMEFNTSLLASSAWRQFIAAAAFPPGAVAAFVLKISPLFRLDLSASNGCCV